MKERPRIVEWVMENCGIANGLEIACISDLPAGSGMGGSSILAAAVLQSISSAVGKVLTHDHLINLVSQVEQVLTTGGGWQDQVRFVGFPKLSVANINHISLVESTVALN